MAQERETRGSPKTTDARTRLARLLQTESELEAMLARTRQEAKRIIEEARRAADARVREFESELEAESQALRDRVASERDRAIDSTRREAREEAERLEAIDDAQITTLARHVIELLVGGPDTRGAR